ncbi:uncharacterized protein ACBR49_019498 isoform 2-T2 [Aulostomus maculatus]
MASPLPFSSLRLLVPPLRLLTAAMWQVVQQQSVKHYGMLEDFVSLVTEAIPQLLTGHQKSLLLLSLRAKVTLSHTQPQTGHAPPGWKCSVSGETPELEVDACSSALAILAVNLTTAERRRLLQDVFNQSFDGALQTLVSDFLSRIDQLFPIPDFKQAASWLDATPGGLEVCLQAADKEELKVLLTNQSSQLGRVTTSEPLSSIEEGQSDLAPGVACPVTLDVELVKEEVVVMMEDEETSMIGQVMSHVEEEASNDSLEVGSDVIPGILDDDRLKDSPGDLVDQSEDADDQSDPPCSDITANALYRISHNSQRVAHKCPQCSKCFIYRSQVIRHLRTNKSCGSTLKTLATANVPTRPGSQEEESRPPESRVPEPRPVRSHACFQCAAVFRSKAELLSHQRSHRTRPIYQCGQCDKEFHHLSSLTNHKQTHLDRGGFTCSSCDKVFKSSKERDAHRLQHRLPDLSCTVCSQAFNSQTQLLRHLQTHSVEGAEPSYSCRFCDQTFSGVTQLRIHQRTHTFRSYQCDQCNKTYGSLTGLQSHRASHNADSRYLCPQCGKRFKTRDGLEGHLRTHTGERPYRCPYCPKDFTALAGLNVHVRRHTGERPYVCTVCGKGWPSGGDLQKHMRTHTGERPYTCLDCGKSFSISCHLTEHRRIHTGEKPFSCPECGKCLRRKFDLKKHMLSHSNVRPYACVSCPKSYTRKTHLNRHLLTHRTAGTEAAGLMSDTH